MTVTASSPTSTRDRHYMQMAERLAWRGCGNVEPNPMVGCVILSADGRVVGQGYHRRFGGPHAELNALEQAGELAAGGTAYITLEPCGHSGKTPPCTEALIRADIARLVIDRRDPHPDAAGGIDQLHDAGIEITVLDDFDAPALRAADRFIHSVINKRPWVIAKWAQTLDGSIATRSGESQWISSPASRRVVHRQRGRVDAILTGIGTVLHDDPMLTARKVRTRRIARRVVIDPKLQIPLDSNLMRTARDVPVTIACHEALLNSMPDRIHRIKDTGAEVIGIPMTGEDLPLTPVLELLTQRHRIATAMTEGGGGLLGRLFEQRLVNEAWVFSAPLLLGDEQATPPVRGRHVEHLTQGVAMQLAGHQARGDDIFAQYVVTASSATRS